MTPLWFWADNYENRFGLPLIWQWATPSCVSTTYWWPE
jgi:hypothetical protein